VESGRGTRRPAAATEQQQEDRDHSRCRRSRGRGRGRCHRILLLGTVTGVKKTDKCSSDGKSFTVAYEAENGDLAIWCLYAAEGVKDEIPDATIKKIMSTLRPLKTRS
jgi:hypothetical protein